MVWDSRGKERLVDSIHLDLLVQCKLVKLPSPPHIKGWSVNIHRICEIVHFVGEKVASSRDGGECRVRSSQCYEDWFEKGVIVQVTTNAVVVLDDIGDEKRKRKKKKKKRRRRRRIWVSNQPGRRARLKQQEQEQHHHGASMRC